MKKLMIAIDRRQCDFDAADSPPRPVGDLNQHESFRCRFAADAASGNNRLKY
jgi:hypothetical protein